MVLWEIPADPDQIPDLFRRGTDPKPATIFPKHVNAGATIRRVYHQVHCAIGFQCGPQRTQTRVGIGEVMQYASADNQIEAMVQFCCALDRQLPRFKIRDVVFLFQSFGVLETRRTDVDTDYTVGGMTERVLRRLPRSTTGDENS